MNTISDGLFAPAGYPYAAGREAAHRSADSGCLDCVAHSIDLASATRWWQGGVDTFGPGKAWEPRSLSVHRRCSGARRRRPVDRITDRYHSYERPALISRWVKVTGLHSARSSRVISNSGTATLRSRRRQTAAPREWDKDRPHDLMDRALEDTALTRFFRSVHAYDLI